jgi:hypothetical protein
VVNPDTEVLEKNPPVSNPEAGSGGGSRFCQMGTTSVCACTDGSSGTQSCLADGTYGPCQCGGGAAGRPGGEAGSNGSRGDDSLYTACNPDGSCAEGLVCSGTRTGQGSYCTRGCEGPGTCPSGGSGDATPVCDGEPPICRLDCAVNPTCPTGMSCLTITGDGQSIATCVWF